jgi:transketolase C-terminal domain/subunit
MFVRRIGLPDRFIEHGSATVLRSNYGLNVQSVVEAVHELFEQHVPSRAFNMLVQHQ